MLLCCTSNHGNEEGKVRSMGGKLYHNLLYDGWSSRIGAS